MKRVFFIANHYDGAYFVLTDNIEEYFKAMAAYVFNLKNSQKENTYSFGSVEMSEADYLAHRQDASALEQQRIEEVRAQRSESEIKISDDDTNDEEANISVLHSAKEKKEKPHLRLV